MRRIFYVSYALLAAATLTGGPALANICEAGPLRCSTTMPADGYCQCTSRGMIEDGTAVSRSDVRQSLNAIAGGCGAEPNAPGCRGTARGDAQ
jgi:hypothetical protein